MPKSAKEFTKITALIKLILNGYPGNWAILREYLQNSDDSGATEQIFILDERTYPTGSLVDGVLASAQGPALIAINNGIITDRDWEALLKINSSSKQEDQTQTGKNGLGFRASYHLTENPHILSGQTLLILDPHNEFTDHPGGVSIDLIEEGAQFQDQILPFASCIEGLTFPYNGTAFRLPLRTENQAKKSDIKQIPTTVSEIQEVFNDFAIKELEEAILFLKHITSIQLFRIDTSGETFCHSKVTIDPPLPPRCPSTLIRHTALTSTDGTVTLRDWKFHYCSRTAGRAEALMTRRLGYDVGNRLIQDKLSATVDIAFPLNGSGIRGRLFTLLPLPQYTDFPIHLNAVFALDPSRQNLKNIQEVGVANSRERLLVEWNKIIFDTWSPEIWTNLLADLSSEALISANWKLWPPQEYGEDCYWSGLTTTFTNMVVSQSMSVFPTVAGQQTGIRLVRIADPDVLLASTNSQISLTLLSDLGVSIVQPPQHIYAALLATKHAVTLTPANLHKVLLRKARSDFEGWDDSDSKVVIDYLVFSSGSADLKNLAGLPLFRRAKDGRRVSLELASYSGIKYFIPQSNVEADIFADSTAMLAWDSFSVRLREQLSQPSASAILGVTIVGPRSVVSFLKERLMHLQSPNPEILDVQSDCDYILKFWMWIVQWPMGGSFFRGHLDGISSLYVLPTSRGSLRKLSAGIIHFDSDESAFISAWNSLDIYSISQGIPDQAVSKLRSAAVIPPPKSFKQIAFLITNANLSSLSTLQTNFASIRNYMFENLPRAKGTLTAAQKAKFKLFPIFFVRDIRTNTTSLSEIDGHCVYVQVDDELSLPLLKGYPNAIYVDVKDSATLSFVRLIENAVTIETEFSVLQMAIDNWDIQPNDTQDRYIDRVFRYRSYQLPAKLFQSLVQLEFVVVNDSTERKRPKNLIDPRSPLNSLYRGEPGRMPAGRFLQDRLLSVMHEFGFLLSSLDPYVVRDRIAYLSSTSIATDGSITQKAREFVNILNHEWKPDYASIIKEYRSREWLPHDVSIVTLVSPSQTRDNYRDDHNHPYYFDRVLTYLHAQTFELPFRVALGWSTKIPPNILVAQLTATLDHSSNRTNRLIKLFTYLNRLLSSNDLDASALQKLRSAVNGRAWLPSNSFSDDVVEACYTLLLGPSQSWLKRPFHFVHPQLLDCLPLLRSLGCNTRPPLGILIAELDNVYQTKSGFKSSASFDMESILCILQEIVTYYKDGLGDAVGINIPGEDGHPHPLPNVYFRDSTISPLNFPQSLQGKYAAHGDISNSLAVLLGIPPLSSLLVGDEEEEEEEEEQMDIDFVTVIRQFLSDYDPKYTLNEILANANDARASSFSIILDQRRRNPVGDLIHPKFKALVSCETLFFYNDSKFSENDFKGIRRVARGGKRGEVNTHGRHGLGALSLYYFTDVATIISGESVLFLDPSSKCLPTFRKGRKRTLLQRKISEIVSSFPGQLERYEGIFGFSSKNPKYDGTIFCLPLKASISEKACNFAKTLGYLENSYRDLASRALLFTNLKHITAAQFEKSQHLSTIWSFSATRTRDQALGSGFEWHELTIRESESHSETHSETRSETKWIIATSEMGVVPEKFFRISQVLKITESTKVQLGLNASAVEGKTFQGYPFSTVSLPRSTSLPFHIDARFAISSNRQDLVLNTANSGGEQDGHTSFNSWILTAHVPPLYLATLNHLVSNGGGARPLINSSRWFFSRCPDVASQIIRDAFFKALPESNSSIFRDVGGDLVSFTEAVFSRGEPRAVIDYLANLQTPNYVTSSQYRPVAHIEGSTAVDPSFVHNVLLANVDTSLTFLSPQDCYDILNYVAQDSTLTLIGLPLLVLQSDDIIPIPTSSDASVYHCEDFDAKSFPRSQFMAIGSYDPNVVARLLGDCAINVVALTQDNAISLISAELKIGSSQHRIQWANSFWKSYHGKLPGPPSIESLERADLPLIEATEGANSSLLTLSQCRPDIVIYDTGNLDEELPGIFHALGIPLVTVKYNRLLKEFFRKRFKDNVLANVLACIVAKGINVLQQLRPHSLNIFSRWIRRHLSAAELQSWSRDPSCMPVNRSDLMQLPIWNVYSNGAFKHGAATNLRVLPRQFEIDAIAPYLRRNIVVAPWSDLLVRFLEFSLRTKSTVELSPSEIFTIISLPATVTSHNEVINLKAFFSSILHAYPTKDLKSCGWTLPDCQGTLRPIHDLYDDTIDLFRTTLTFTQPPSFLHDEFKSSFTPKLRALGLVHEITVENFSHCANAVAAAYREHGNDPNMWNAVRRMSDEAFNVYQTQIPALMLLGCYFNWSSTDNVSFVLRKRERRQGVSYVIRDNYVAGPLPLILPPSSFVLPAHEPIAWTQRALFFTEPIEGLVTVNKTLGIPTAEEVVAHLVLLTTVIAIDHPRDRTLLSDIKATYTWLNENATSAMSSLLQFNTKRLFLNLEDPSTDSWSASWASAEELVLNMEFDQGPVKIVRGFIKPYEALLRAAGCAEIKNALSALPALKALTTDSWKIELEKMRKANELTDMELLPTFEPNPTANADNTTLVENDDVAFTPITPTAGIEVNEILDNYLYAGGTNTIERKGLRAHRVIMAAAIPHLRNLQLWNSQAGGGDEITFYGSAFAAKAIIDFVYTGEIELSVTTADKTKLTHLMHDLLDVLPVVDEWGMADLKQRIQWEIVGKHEIVRRLPEEYDTLLSHATKYNADQILVALKELEPIRARMQRLREGTN